MRRGWCRCMCGEDRGQPQVLYASTAHLFIFRQALSVLWSSSSRPRQLAWKFHSASSSACTAMSVCLSVGSGCWTHALVLARQELPWLSSILSPVHMLGFFKLISTSKTLACCDDGSNSCFIISVVWKWWILNKNHEKQLIYNVCLTGMCHFLAGDLEMIVLFPFPKP